MTMGNSVDWDFDAPKFWDLTEADGLKRPTDSWFANAMASPASFGKQLHSLQPFFPTHTFGKKTKLFGRAKGTGIIKETSQASQHNAAISTPNQPEVYPINNEIRTTYKSPSLHYSHTFTDPPHDALLQPEPNRNPTTVEIGRNRPYNEEEGYLDHVESTKQGEKFKVEEMEVKRKYKYMNYERMHEAIKKAKVVLEESRQKSEQWALMKKKSA